MPAQLHKMVVKMYCDAENSMKTKTVNLPIYGPVKYPYNFDEAFLYYLLVKDVIDR